MNRDEAIQTLKDALGISAHEGGSFVQIYPHTARDIIAALSSCACGGREPLKVKKGWSTKSSLEGMIPGWWPEANDEWDDPAEFPVTVIYIERALPTEKEAT